MTAKTKSNLPRIGIGEFTRNAFALNRNEFKQAMKMTNHDKKINDIKIVAWSEAALEAYEKK